MGGGMGAMKRMASTLEIFTGSSGTIVLLEVGEPAARGERKLRESRFPIRGNAYAEMAGEFTKRRTAWLPCW